jgi:hypothetical protein
MRAFSVRFPDGPNGGPVMSAPSHLQLTGIIPVTHRGPANGQFLAYLAPTLYQSLFHCVTPINQWPASSPDCHPFPTGQPKFHFDC